MLRGDLLPVSFSFHPHNVLLPPLTGASFGCKKRSPPRSSRLSGGCEEEEERRATDRRVFRCEDGCRGRAVSDSLPHLLLLLLMGSAKEGCGGAGTGGETRGAAWRPLPVRAARIPPILPSSSSHLSWPLLPSPDSYDSCTSLKCPGWSDVAKVPR